ncbi:MAG: CBS domain-containing protein [Myxococcota bacterium]
MPSTATLLVQDVMTPSPKTIEVTQSLAEARRLMKKIGARHLPVVDDGELVGVLSERDVALLATHAEEDVAVGEAMSRAPWTVTPTTPVEVAARHMARRKLGSAVVVDDEEKVVGIFTSTDGLRTLAELLAKQAE